VPVAVEAADSQADPAGSPTGIQADLKVRLQAETQVEEEENRLDVGTSNEQESFKTSLAGVWGAKSPRRWVAL